MEDNKVVRDSKGRFIKKVNESHEIKENNIPIKIVKGGIYLVKINEDTSDNLCECYVDCIKPNSICFKIGCGNYTWQLKESFEKNYTVVDVIYSPEIVNKTYPDLTPVNDILKYIFTY